MGDAPDATQSEPEVTTPPAVPDTEYRAGRPFAFTDVTSLQAAIKKYFDEQDPHTELQLQKTGQNKTGGDMFSPVEILTEQQHYTVTGLARALGVSRRTLNNYTKYAHYSDAIDEPTKQGLILAIADAYQRVEEYNEQGLHVPGRANGIKFNLVNNFDWADKTIQETRSAKDDLDDLETEVDQRDEMAVQAAAALEASTAATHDAPPPPPPAEPTTEPEHQNDDPGPTTP